MNVKLGRIRASQNTQARARTMKDKLKLVSVLIGGGLGGVGVLQKLGSVDMELNTYIWPRCPRS